MTPAVAADPLDRRPAATIERALPVLTQLAAVFLYSAVAHIGTYIVTCGGIFSAVVVAMSLRRVHQRAWAFALAGGLCLWPWLVFIGAGLLHGALLPTQSEFLLSDALWTVSIAILLLAAVSRSPVGLRVTRPISILLLGLMIVQTVGARFFGTDVGYRLIAPLIGFDIFHSYLGIEDLANARAMATYYEPSMCARVLGTLCFIDLLLHRRYASNFVLIVLATMLTQSFGLIVLAAAMGAILLGRSLRGVLIFVAAAAILVSAASGLVERRADFRTSESTYIRLVAPLNTLGWAIANYPLGIPLGSAETLASRTGYTAETREAKITNGVYEFVGFFGLVGVALLAVGVGAVATLFLRDEQELAAALLYLLISTALSSSFLSIESSLLTYFFIVAARTARKARIDESRAREQPPRSVAAARPRATGERAPRPYAPRSRRVG